MSGSPETPRPRSRILSLGSRHSRHSRSSGSNELTRGYITESPEDKANRRTKTKADPNLAMNEAQPAAKQQEEMTFTSLRSMQHKDSDGNIITDPDPTNPTRKRLERPLETIMSFERAIDSSYNRRASQMGPPSVQSPRSSYYPSPRPGSSLYPAQRYRADAGGVHPAHRMVRPESYADGGMPRASPLPFAAAGRPMPRNRSDPMLYGGNAAATAPASPAANRASGVYDGRYPAPYDAATTGSGSGTETWANSTDPSSENSSVDRIHQHHPGAGGALAGPSSAAGQSVVAAAAAPKAPQPPPHAFGHRAAAPHHPPPPPQPETTEAQDFFGGFGRTQTAPLPALGPALPNHNAQYPMGPPPPPAHSQPSRGGVAAYGAPAPHGPAAHAPQSPPAPRSNMLRKTSDKAPAVTVKKAEGGEKRKSWLKRKFGKGT